MLKKYMSLITSSRKKKPDYHIDMDWLLSQGFYYMKDGKFTWHPGIPITYH